MLKRIKPVRPKTTTSSSTRDGLLFPEPASYREVPRFFIRVPVVLLLDLTGSQSMCKQNGL